MEAALFTLDVVLLVILILAVRKADRTPPAERSLGFFSFLTAKTDAVQKRLHAPKDKRHA